MQHVTLIFILIIKYYKFIQKIYFLKKELSEVASFQKRGKTWQYTVSRMVNGKPKPIRKGGFRTKKEAQIAAAEVESELSKGIIPHLHPIPFATYFKRWIRTFKKPHIKRNTLNRYLNTLETIKKYFGDKSLQDINKREYQEFLNKYGQLRAKATSDKLNTHIRACVKDAIDEGIIHMDFTRGAKPIGRKEKRSEEKHLSYLESKKLLNEIYKNLNKSLNHYLLLLALTSGMRFGELVGLTRNDFNFYNNTISINKTWGYTNKMHDGFGPTKNEQSIRTIKMDKKTMKSFKKLFNNNKITDNIHQLVFYSPSSKYKIISNNASNNLLRKTLKKLDIQPITMHGLRHTHASVLLYKKVSIYYVSERLGHKDIETTLNNYSHVIKELRTKDEKASVEVYENMVS